ncbi:hypothetical protein KIN20_003911, partial [Parelaphostrongylus tenuis]
QQVSANSETFEQLYNTACQLIEAGNYELALTSLDKSVELCRETLNEEGLDEDEVEDELAVLYIQRAYVLHKLGRKKEAIEIYRTLQAAGPSDIGVMITLANNLASAMEEQSIADARRKLKSALQLDQKKLSTRQRRVLMLNNALVLLHSNQREPCRRALDDLMKTFGPTRDSRLIEAALYFRLNEFEKAIKMLENGDLQMEMTRIHLMVNSGKLENAVTALKELPENVRLQSAVVSLAISLLISLEKKEDALRMLNEAMEHMQDVKTLQQLLHQAAVLESSRGNAAAAAAYLEKLLEFNPSDIKVLCRLIRAYTDCNPQKAEELSAKVFPMTVDESIDVDNLEESDGSFTAKSISKRKKPNLKLKTRKL